MSDPERGIMFLSKTPEPVLSAAASKFFKLPARIVPFGLPNPRCVPHAPSELLAQNEKKSNFWLGRVFPVRIGRSRVPEIATLSFTEPVP
jgi:hypothetical protein